MKSRSLSPELRAYLANADYLPADTRLLVDQKPAAADDAELLPSVDDETKLRLADLLTVRLAQAGFDSEYRLTREGALLEDLIDMLRTEDGGPGTG